MTSVIVDTMHPRLLFETIRTSGIEYVAAVPEIFQLLFRLYEPSLRLPSLKAFVSGGNILTSEDCASLQEAFQIEVLHGYGLTEFTPVSGNARSETRLGTVGTVCDDVQCCIDKSGTDRVGEVLIKTPHKTGVYYHRLRESNEARTNDGWFKTGSRGRSTLFESQMKDGHHA